MSCREPVFLKSALDGDSLETALLETGNVEHSHV